MIVITGKAYKVYDYEAGFFLIVGLLIELHSCSLHCLFCEHRV